MIKDLDKIYETAGNPKGEQSDTPPVHPGDLYLQQIKNTPKQPGMQSAGASFKVEGVSKKDQNKFFGESGIYDPALTGTNIYTEAGNRQGFGNKLARRLVNLVPNVAADLLDMVGSLSSLAFEWGNDRDYRNGLNELADSIKNPMGENYKRSDDTWAFSDPTWWIDNVFNTIEYAGAYAAGGAGVAKTLGSIAKSAGAFFNAGVNGMKWINGAAKLGTSAFVSYAQGAQDGASVFNAVYNTQLKKALASGQDYEEAQNSAKHIASQAAATTAQLSTILTMAINTGAYNGIIKSQNAVVKDILASRIAQAESKSASSVLKALRGTTMEEVSKKLIHRNGIRGVLDEMWREGGEEVLQQFAQQTGMDVGNKGKIKGFIEQFGELENIVDRVGNSEGLFAFTLGSVFGGLQHTMLNNIIPSRHTEKLNADGSFIPKMDGDVPVVKNGIPVFQKHWVTPRTYERDFTKRYFNSAKEALAYDFENHDNLQTEFLKAVKEKNSIRADEIRDEMFNVGQLYAVREGMSDAWKNTFEHISKMTPQEAVQSGYAENENDKAYISNARKAIQGIDFLERTYNTISERFGSNDDNPATKALVDMLFARRADLYSTKQRIDKYEEELEKDETDEDGKDNEIRAKSVNDSVRKLVRAHNSYSAVGKQLDEDIEALKKGNIKTAEKLLKKYRASGYGDGVTEESVKSLIAKINGKKSELVQEIVSAEEQLLMAPEYKTWLDKNPEKSFTDYLQELNNSSIKASQMKFRRAQLEMARAEFDIAWDNYREVSEQKNVTRFSKKAEKWFSELKREGEEIERNKNKRIAAMTKDQAALERLNRIADNNLAEKYRADRDQTHDTISENYDKIQRLKKELAENSANPDKVADIKKRIGLLEFSNTKLSEKASILDSLYRMKEKPTGPAVGTVSKESVDGTENGKITGQADEVPTTGTVAAGTETPVVAKVSDNVSVDDELEALTKSIEGLTEVVSGTDPVEEFRKLYNKAHKSVQTKLNFIVNAMMAGEIGHSLDSLNQEISAGLIKAEDARVLLLATRDYVDQLQRDLEKKNEEKPVTQPGTAQEKVDILVSRIGSPETPAVISEPEIAGTVVENEMHHAGYKIVNAAFTGATSTIGYEEGIRQFENGKTAYVKVVRPDKLNENVPEELLTTELLAGRELRYEIDTDYNGPKQITDALALDENNETVMETESISDYMDSNGNIKTDDSSVGNVPIKVTDAKTGKTLFYIRKSDWILAKYPNTKDYRNVAERTKDTEDNVTLQNEMLLQLRKSIVESYNFTRTGLDGKLEAKSTGRLILNYRIDKRDGLNMKYGLEYAMAYNRKDPGKSMLPDESLTVVIIGKDRMPKDSNNHNFQGPLGIDHKSLFPGTVGAMVPAANGKYLVAPLVGMKLAEEGKPSYAFNTIKRVIELFLLNDGSVPAITEEILALEKNTNFNVGTAAGLKSFINQYFTYSQFFDDSALSPNANTETKSEKFVFSIDTGIENIADKTKIVKLGFTMRGDGVKYANLVNGKLSPEFAEVLMQGLQERSRAVVFPDASMSIKGINSKGKFIEAVHTDNKGWIYNEHSSYNNYVKGFSKTPVYGRNKLKNGSYVYIANPNLQFSRPVVPNTTVKPAEHITKVSLADTNNDLDLFDSLRNFMYKPVKTPVINAIGTGLQNSDPVTFATLQKKYNFTPEEQRNGKTPLEILNELTSRGHTYLPKGYNPFSRCL